METRKKIAVIGGSGFVGSKLISKLDKKEVYNLDKRPSPFFKNISSLVDITKPEQIKFQKNTETVILLAAEHKDNISPTSLYYDVNVEGTKNVLNEMDKSNIKNLIFTSSVAIYGINKNNPNENHEVDPFNHYGKSKWEAEKVIQKWFSKSPKSKSATIIRPTVIFGERNRGNVYNLLKQICIGKFIMIGSGENKKSMAYVSNVVHFIMNRIKMSEKGVNIYNYSDSPDLNMNQLVSIIEKKMSLKIPKFKIPYMIGIIFGYIFDIIAILTKKEVNISSVRVKKFCATTQFNSEKAHSVFKAPYLLIEGLNKTLEFEFLNDNDDDVLFYSE